MLKIAIVDDDRVVLFALSQKIKDYFQTKCVSCAIETFASGKDLLEQREPFDILFLDIQMDGLSGMETATLWRQKRTCLYYGLAGICVTLLPRNLLSGSGKS